MRELYERMRDEGRRKKEAGRREKGERRKEKGEGRRETREGRREKGDEKGEGRRIRICTYICTMFNQNRGIIAYAIFTKQKQTSLAIFVPRF